jgi:hypothetical protein
VETEHRSPCRAIPGRALAGGRTFGLERLFRDRLAQRALGGRNTRACNEFVQRCEKRRRPLAGVRSGGARRDEAEAQGAGLAHRCDAQRLTVLDDVQRPVGFHAHAGRMASLSRILSTRASVALGLSKNDIVIYTTDNGAASIWSVPIGVANGSNRPKE